MTYGAKNKQKTVGIFASAGAAALFLSVPTTRQAAFRPIRTLVEHRVKRKGQAEQVRVEVACKQGQFKETADRLGLEEELETYLAVKEMRYALDEHVSMLSPQARKGYIDRAMVQSIALHQILRISAKARRHEQT